MTIKQNDTSRPILGTLYLDDVAIDLTTADTVELLWRRRGSATPAVAREATITNAALGQVSYTPIADDVALAGEYHLEWRITYANTTQLTVPSSGYIELNIERILG
jgi:hypothetical protein